MSGPVTQGPNEVVICHEVCTAVRVGTPSHSAGHTAVPRPATFDHGPKSPGVGVAEEGVGGNETREVIGNRGSR